MNAGSLKICILLAAIFARCLVGRRIRAGKGSKVATTFSVVVVDEYGTFHLSTQVISATSEWTVGDLRNAFYLRLSPKMRAVTSKADIIFTPPRDIMSALRKEMSPQDILERFSKEGNSVEMFAYADEDALLIDEIMGHEKVLVFRRDFVSGLVGGIFNGTRCKDDYFSPGYMGSLQGLSAPQEYFFTIGRHRCGVSIIGSPRGLEGIPMSLGLKINSVGGPDVRSKNHFTGNEHQEMWFNPLYASTKKITVQAIALTAAHCVTKVHRAAPGDGCGSVAKGGVVPDAEEVWVDVETGRTLPATPKPRRRLPKIPPPSPHPTHMPTDEDPHYYDQYYGDPALDSTKTPTMTPTVDSNVCIRSYLDEEQHSRVAVQLKSQITDSMASFGVLGFHMPWALGEVVAGSKLSTQNDVAVLFLGDYRVAGMAGLVGELDLKETTYEMILQRSPKLGDVRLDDVDQLAGPSMETFGWGSHGYKGQGPEPYFPAPPDADRTHLQCLTVGPTEAADALLRSTFFVRSMAAKAGTSQGDSGSPVALAVDTSFIVGIVVNGHVTADGEKWSGIASLQNPDPHVQRILCNSFFRFVWGKTEDSPPVGGEKLYVDCLTYYPHLQKLVGVGQYVR